MTYWFRGGSYDGSTRQTARLLPQRISFTGRNHDEQIRAVASY